LLCLAVSGIQQKGEKQGQPKRERERERGAGRDEETGLGIPNAEMHVAFPANEF
jgi:hypothetical protein